MAKTGRPITLAPSTCPFCGAAAEEWIEPSSNYVGIRCGEQRRGVCVLPFTKLYPNRTLAVRAWNRGYIAPKL